MSILYWGHDAEGFQQCLNEQAETPHAARLEQQISLGELCQNLLARRTECPVVVLAPTTHTELKAAMTMRHMLLGMPLVVRLEPADPDTVALARQLRPRFLATGDVSEMDIAAIVLRLKEKNREIAEAELAHVAARNELLGGT